MDFLSASSLELVNKHIRCFERFYVNQAIFLEFLGVLYYLYSFHRVKILSKLSIIFSSDLIIEKFLIFFDVYHIVVFSIWWDTYTGITQKLLLV